MILLLIVAFILVAMLDVPQLKKQGNKRELIVYAGFLFFAFVLSLLQLLDVAIPSPMKGVNYLFLNVLHMSYPPG